MATYRDCNIKANFARARGSRGWILLIGLLSLGVAIRPALGLSASQTLTMTAVDPDGTNTGTARLGVPVTFTTNLTPGPSQLRGWTVQGAESSRLAERTV